MTDDALIDFIDAMCRTGEAGRYGWRPIEPAAVQFADELREQAKAQFDESRELLQRAKAALKNYATEVLKGQVNEKSNCQDLWIKIIRQLLAGRPLSAAR